MCKVYRFKPGALDAIKVKLNLTTEEQLGSLLFANGLNGRATVTDLRNGYPVTARFALWLLEVCHLPGGQIFEPVQVRLAA